MYSQEMFERLFLFLKSKNLSDKTINSIINRIRRISDEVQPLTPETYLVFHTNILKKHSASACNKFKQAMDHFCDFRGIDRFKIPRLREKTKPKITLSVAEISMILGCFQDQYSPFLKILAYTGMRPGEVFALQPQHIDRNNNILLVETSKTGEGRIVPLPDVNHIPLPFSFSDTALKKNLNKRLKLCCIEKNVTPYTFRHSFITRMLAEGVPLFIVQQIVGHSKADTTARYFHANTKMLHEASLLDPLRRKDIPPEKIVEQVEKHIKKALSGLKTDRIELQKAITHLYQAISGT